MRLPIHSCGNQPAIRWTRDKPWFSVHCACGAAGPTFLASHGATEDEAIAEWINRQCACCGGKRVVTDANGVQRPCSRCDAEGFNRWSKEREPDEWEVAGRAAGWERVGSSFNRYGISIAYVDWKTLCLSEGIRPAGRSA